MICDLDVEICSTMWRRAGERPSWTLHTQRQRAAGRKAGWMAGVSVGRCSQWSNEEDGGQLAGATV